MTVGMTQMMTRTRQQAMRLEKQPDGTFKNVPVPGVLTTVYGFGGTPPLVMTRVWKRNLAQFERARRTFDAYVGLLTEGIGAISRTT